MFSHKKRHCQSFGQKFAEEKSGQNIFYKIVLEIFSQSKHTWQTLNFKNYFSLLYS